MKEHKYKKGWRLFFQNGRLGSKWYRNSKFPNIALIMYRVSGVLFPYSFALGEFTTDNGQLTFEGKHSSKYNGLNATQNSDYFANKLQKEYQKQIGEKNDKL